MVNKADEIKAYWENRAANDSTEQSTTMDIWLRHIEAEYVHNQILSFKPKTVCDLGCGDGLTTIRSSKSLSNVQFTGYDYSESMIRNAMKNARDNYVKNIEFKVGDITNKIQDEKFDFIFTTRCLINLVSWDSQKKALSNISNMIENNGFFLMVENFIEGHEKFNEIRDKFALPVIPVRHHNLFFKKNDVLELMSNEFELISDVNISSSYYLASRVLYSKICSIKNEVPDYNDIHHELASQLPFLGNFGPLSALMFRKK